MNKSSNHKYKNFSPNILNPIISTSSITKEKNNTIKKVQKKDLSCSFSWNIKFLFFMFKFFN